MKYSLIHTWNRTWFTSEIGKEIVTVSLEWVAAMATWDASGEPSSRRRPPRPDGCFSTSTRIISLTLLDPRLAGARRGRPRPCDSPSPSMRAHVVRSRAPRGVEPSKTAGAALWGSGTGRRPSGELRRRRREEHGELIRCEWESTGASLRRVGCRRRGDDVGWGRGYRRWRGSWLRGLLDFFRKTSGSFVGCGLWSWAKEATMYLGGLLIEIGSFWLASGSRVSSSWLVIQPSWNLSSARLKILTSRAEPSH
jgi:hypothetical protein